MHADHDEEVDGDKIQMKQCLEVKIMYFVIKFTQAGVINAFKLQQF